MFELIQQKVTLCEEALTALEAIVPESYDKLFSDKLLLPAIERHFQILVDAAVDCNNLFLEQAGKDKAETYFGSWSAMRDQNILPVALVDAIAPSVGLRNALVHRYETIDRRRMYESIKRFLPRYREYLQYILKHTK